MFRSIILALVLLTAATWAAFGRPPADAPSRRNPVPAQESASGSELPSGAAPSAQKASPEAAPASQPAAGPTAGLTMGDSVDQMLEWAARPTRERVDEAVREFRQSTDPRRRAIALYVLARSRRLVAHVERDAVLDNEALPFLHEVTLSPTTDATRPAILALSAMGVPEAARILALASRDPREPQKAAEALSALIVRPDRHAVAALEDLARDRASGRARVRAIRALLTAAAVWGPQAEDLDARAALSEARRFLDMEARGIADSISRTTRVVAVQEDARALAEEIGRFFADTNQ